jgi:hypothetical protein
VSSQKGQQEFGLGRNVRLNIVPVLLGQPTLATAGRILDRSMSKVLAH